MIARVCPGCRGRARKDSTHCRRCEAKILGLALGQKHSLRSRRKARAAFVHRAAERSLGNRPAIGTTEDASLVHSGAPARSEKQMLRAESRGLGTYTEQGARPIS